MKECFNCKKIKKFSEFYKDLSEEDGYHIWCKDCKKEYDKKRYMEKRKFLLEQAKVYRHTEAGKAQSRRTHMEQFKKYPEKFKTRYVSKELVRKGIMAQLACEACGNFISQAHHPDYSNPYLVVWLCKDHHWEIHKLFK